MAAVRPYPERGEKLLSEGKMPSRQPAGRRRYRFEVETVRTTLAERYLSIKFED
jgi:hypothetical protein